MNIRSIKNREPNNVGIVEVLSSLPQVKNQCDFVTPIYGAAASVICIFVLFYVQTET